MKTSRYIRYVQRCPCRAGYRAQDSGRGEGVMFTHHGGRDGRGERGNNTDQAAVPGCNKIIHEKIRCYS